MNDYVIGSAAVLTAGPAASIACATVHAQTDPVLAAQVRVALIDFESNSSGELSQVIAMATGWNGRRMAEEFIAPLVARRECTLADVVVALTSVAGESSLHLFARWLPDEGLARALAAAGVTLVVHPLDAIRQVALISGQSYRRWPSPLRAA
jgi:hypothetical protein